MGPQLLEASEFHGRTRRHCIKKHAFLPSYPVHSLNLGTQSSNESNAYRSILYRPRLNIARLPKPSRAKFPSIACADSSPSDDSFAQNGQSEGNDSDKEPEPKAKSAIRQINRQQTKNRLLKILDALINLDTQRAKIEELILDLESLKATPATEAFTELALAGEWLLVFSSMSTTTKGNVRLREIGQVFDIEKKKLTNRVIWTYVSRDREHQFYANLLITCSYSFVDAGRLQVKLEGHNVKILEGPFENKLPDSDTMQAVIKELQLALPREFFDPTGLIDVTYLEPNFRIARFFGKRIAGVRNVFVRPGESKSQR